jgi:hypothetical protein
MLYKADLRDTNYHKSIPQTTHTPKRFPHTKRMPMFHYYLVVQPIYSELRLSTSFFFDSIDSCSDIDHYFLSKYVNL